MVQKLSGLRSPQSRQFGPHSRDLIPQKQHRLTEIDLPTTSNRRDAAGRRPIASGDVQSGELGPSLSL
jgi:hypothetical protein